MMPLGSLAEKRPQDIVQYDDIIIKHMLMDSTAAAQGGNLLVQLASVSDVSKDFSVCKNCYMCGVYQHSYL